MPQKATNSASTTPADFNHELYSLGMEIPDQLDNVLSRGIQTQEEYLKSAGRRTE